MHAPQSSCPPRWTAETKLKSIRPRSGSSGWCAAAAARSVASARGRGRVREWGAGDGGRRHRRAARAQQRARARRRRSTDGARCFANCRRGATPRHGQRHDRHYQARVPLWWVSASAATWVLVDCAPGFRLPLEVCTQLLYLSTSVEIFDILQR